MDAVLRGRPRSLGTVYAHARWPSIPPERLLRAWRSQLSDSMRSGRLLLERLDSKALFRWFIGRQTNPGVLGHAVSSNNRKRLL
ncbi:MAG: transposase [Bryobacterales bacterium]|nr:transposase [Bryobacterales bacterium]